MELNLSLNYAPRVWQQFIHNDPHRFKVVLAHRSAGKTWLAMAELLKHAINNPGDYAYIAPEKEQGKRNMWNKLKECSEEIIKNVPGVKVNETEKFIELSSKSRIYILAADKNVRGLHMKGMVLDEVADIEYDLWDEVLFPTLTANKGWAIIIGTPKKGKNLLNHLKDFGYRGDLPDWKTWIVDVNTSGVYEGDYIDTLRRTMHPSTFAQEYLMEESSTRGAIYAPMLDELSKMGQIGQYPYDSRLPVYTGWDLGYNDKTVIWFAQLDVGTNRIFIIDYYEDSVKLFDEYMEIILRKPYHYAKHYMPHDFDRNSMYKTYSAAAKMHSLKQNFEVVQKPANGKLKDHVMAAQSMIYRCFFNKSACEDGLKGLYTYENKKNKRTGEYEDAFQHNDIADAFRYLLEGLSGARKTQINHEYTPVQKTVKKSIIGNARKKLNLTGRGWTDSKTTL
jgi:hypothetical protein